MTWFLILNVFDVLLTLYVLKHGGSEKNPLLAKWFTLDDPDVVLVRMKVAALCATWLLHYFGGQACIAWQTWATCALPDIGLTAMVLGYAGLAAWNVRSVYRTWKRVNQQEAT